MLHVPKLFVSFVSVQRLVKLKDYNILFDDLDAYLCSKVNRSRIGFAKIKQGRYYLPGLDPKSLVADGLKVVSVQPSTTRIEPIIELHHKMGHPSFHLPKQMYPLIFKDTQLEILICVACQLGKFKRKIYLARNNRTKKPFQILHYDV